jgi:carboxypeptidase Q
MISRNCDFTGVLAIDMGGRIRGIHLQGNDMGRPIFESWMAPFRDLGVTTITIQDTGYTDHVSFDSVGLPGFQFIQDSLDYESRTHHSDLDLADHIDPADLMQASAVLAWYVYNAANSDERIPRKPLPRLCQRSAKISLQRSKRLPRTTV